MVFENDLVVEPSLRSQVTSHLPIAIIAVGVLATMVSLHLALAGVVVLAVAHILLGVGLLAARRHRAQRNVETSQ